MDTVTYRLILLISFVAYMAALYVGLHIVVARFSKSPGSRMLWFFSVLTAPLLRPLRAVLPAQVTEAQLRYVTLAACIALWLAARLLLAVLGGSARG
jgi:uncharacterized protein YggT (Ycf19 family)